MKKELIRYIVLALLTMCVGMIGYSIFKNSVQFDRKKVEPYTSDSIGYIELNEETRVTQGFVIKERNPVLLESIDTIFVNLPEGRKQGRLTFAILDQDGNQVSINQFDIASLVVGEYVQLSLKEPFMIEPNKIYYLAFMAEETDSVPYLLIQNKINQNYCNKELAVDDEIYDGTLLVNYQYVGILPNVIKVMIAVILVLILLAGYQILFGIERELTHGIIIAICLCSLIPFLVLGSYNRQLCDDFDYSTLTHAAVVQEDGTILDVLKAAWETDIHYFNTWQGLYSSAFLLALQPGIYGEKYYTLTTPILLLIFFVTTYFFIKIVRRLFCHSKKRILLWTVVLTTTLVQGLPSLREGIYWYCGAMTYMPFFFGGYLTLYW